MSDHEDYAPESPILSHSEEEYDERPLNGLYIDMAPFGLEKIWDYEPGGHHVVHLDDHLGREGEYRVIHKLGSGGFANVWLCQVLRNGIPHYVALKILMADYSKDDCPELRVERLRAVGLEKHICLPFDRFRIEGPNGSHLGFVYPVAGPRVSLIAQLFEDPDRSLRKMARQATEVMAALHSHGICHGDFTPSNILLKVEGLDGLPENEVLKILGYPVKVEVFTELGETPSDPTAPKYLVRPVKFRNIPLPYVVDGILLIDFGESYDVTNPPEELGIPESYRSPELVLENTPGFGSDLWALGCALFEIRTGRKLFDMFDDDDDSHLFHMVETLGALPEPWWSTTWKHRKEFFKDEPDLLGQAVLVDALAKEQSDLSVERPSIELALRRGLHYWDLGPGEKFSREIPPDEIEQLADLLKKILQYEPSRRLTAAEVLEHEWFRLDEN
ncbi:hypothetical protein CNMCM6457_007161 [Aspergillus fumigatiaffinis]|nr:hypothetical protein CNMCM6457_007161 [Aspergillus fumigatiaffinis]